MSLKEVQRLLKGGLMPKELGKMKTIARRVEGKLALVRTEAFGLGPAARRAARLGRACDKPRLSSVSEIEKLEASPSLFRSLWRRCAHDQRPPGLTLFFELAGAILGVAIHPHCGRTSMALDHQGLEA